MERNDTASAELRAGLVRSELLWEALSAASGSAAFESFEDDTIRIGHEEIAGAMAAALERSGGSRVSPTAVMSALRLAGVYSST